MSTVLTRTSRSSRTARLTRVTAGAAVLPLALALTACGSDDDTDAAAPAATVTVTESADAGSSATDSPSGSPTSSAAGAGQGDETGLRAAARTALGSVSGTVVTVDRDDNGWDVTVVSGDGVSHDFDISLDGSSIERGPDVDDDDAEDRREEQRLVQGATLDYLAAIEAARGSAGGATVSGVDLDEDNGRIGWDVDFGDDPDEQTVTVDAASGEVIGTERDNDDD